MKKVFMKKKKRERERMYEHERAREKGTNGMRKWAGKKLRKNK